MEKQQVGASGPDKIYNFVLSELKAGKRPVLKLDNSELEQIKEDLKRRISEDQGDFRRPMAVLCHLQQGKPELIDLLHEAYFAAEASSQIFVLRAFEKHSLESMFLKGQKVGIKTLEVLSHALKSEDLELEDYVLYLLEQIGIQIVVFKKELQIIGARKSWFQKAKKQNKEKALKLLEKIPSF